MLFSDCERMVGVKLCRVAGFIFELHISFWLVVAFLMFSLQPIILKYFPCASVVQYISILAMWIVMLVFSIWVHEMAHSVVASYFGVNVDKIVMFALGGCAVMNENPKTPLGEFLIAIVGPILSFCIGLIMLVFSYQHANISGWMILNFAYLNIFISIFNMLPIYPMDGGRVMHSILWKIKGEKVAGMTSSYSSAILSILLACWGLVDLLNGKFGGIFRIAMGGIIFLMAIVNMHLIKSGKRLL